MFDVLHLFNEFELELTCFDSKSNFNSWQFAPDSIPINSNLDCISFSPAKCANLSPFSDMLKFEIMGYSDFWKAWSRLRDELDLIGQSSHPCEDLQHHNITTSHHPIASPKITWNHIQAWDEIQFQRSYWDAGPRPSTDFPIFFQTFKSQKTKKKRSWDVDRILRCPWSSWMAQLQRREAALIHLSRCTTFITFITLICTAWI